jgi:hypothetical protein
MTRRNASLLLALALALCGLLAPSAQASFGVESFSIAPEAKDGTTDFQAGSHPYELAVDIAMNSHEEGGEQIPDGTLRTLIVDLPPGMAGSPAALPACPRADFEGVFTHCPADTQIGMAYVDVANLGTVESAVFNLVPPLGAPAAIALSIDNVNSFQEASVRSDTDFGVSVADVTVPTEVEILSIEERIWGVPASEEHRPQRACPGEVLPGAGGPTCPSDAPLAPFLTLPTSCGAPPLTTIEVESQEQPGHPVSKQARFEEGGEAFGLSGCNAEQFEPRISFKPTTDHADAPTGLDVDVHQRQDEACAEEAGEVACEGSTAHLRDFTATLPKGLAVNPSAANGLDACSEQQIGYQPWEGKVRFSKDPQSCPDAAKLGALDVTSPLVDHKLGGAVYLAKPYDNPFGSLIALYLAIEDPRTGIVAKLASKVVPDPATGRLTATVTESPQLPLEDVELHFYEGARAALTTPIACGTYTTTSTLTPWSAPEGQDAHPQSSFGVSAPASGQASCPASEGQAPNSPNLEAGTTSPQAGAYAPFVLKLSRPPGSQPISTLTVSPPPGLLGRLAGVPYCPEAKIAQARARERPNMGRVEEADPSCPAASQVGTATVGAGSGPDPFYATGRAYLAGPYEGAPASFVFVTPAVAGPFDLGTVVVRAPIYVNPETARLTVRSDPIPTALEGIPLDVRSIAVTVSRPDFTLNPTSCEPMSLGVGVLSSLGGTASLANRFQVGGCSSLPFKPKLVTRIYGKTKRGAFPKLVAKIFARGGEANSSRLAVTLPHSEFLEQGHFGTICTRVQFAAHACPAKSVYGWVRVKTPLLAYELEGPVYLRSSNHNLPDMVLDLKGPVWQPIEITLVSRIDSKHNGIRSTFEGIPDAPFEEATLSMRGGKQGLLVNSTDVCAKANRSLAKLAGQNGATLTLKPKLVNPKCGKHHKKKRKGHKRHRRVGR